MGERAPDAAETSEFGVDTRIQACSRERGVKGFVRAVERDGGAIASSIAVIEFGPDLL